MESFTLCLQVLSLFTCAGLFCMETMCRQHYCESATENEEAEKKGSSRLVCTGKDMRMVDSVKPKRNTFGITSHRTWLGLSPTAILEYCNSLLNFPFERAAKSLLYLTVLRALLRGRGCFGGFVHYWNGFSKLRRSILAGGLGLPLVMLLLLHLHRIWSPHLLSKIMLTAVM